MKLATFLTGVNKSRRGWRGKGKTASANTALQMGFSMVLSLKVFSRLHDIIDARKVQAVFVLQLQSIRGYIIHIYNPHIQDGIEAAAAGAATCFSG